MTGRPVCSGRQLVGGVTPGALVCWKGRPAVFSVTAGTEGFLQAVFVALKDWIASRCLCSASSVPPCCAGQWRVEHTMGSLAGGGLAYWRHALLNVTKNECARPLPTKLNSRLVSR